METKTADKSVRKLNLEQKSEQELKELLKMQENLLQNKRLIQMLPDKGKKISEFVEEIQQALKAIDAIDQTVQRFNKMQLGHQHKDLSDKIEDAVLRDLQKFANNPAKEKIIIDERINCPNSYEFIMKKNNFHENPPSKKFMLNRLPSKVKNDFETVAVENSSLMELSQPSDSKVSSIPSQVAKENKSLNREGKELNRRLKHIYDASLEEEMHMNEGRYSRGIKMISIEESMELLNTHQRAIKEAELKRAEAMLLANSNTRFSTDDNLLQGDKFSKYRDEQEFNIEDHDKNDDDTDSQEDD